MEYIENEIFIHIQRESNGMHLPLWNVGETYFIGQKKNRFVEYFDFVDYQFYPENLKSVNDALTHQTKIVRELIFEEVRKEFFPSHPSRQRCLWVIKADDEGSLNYWQNTLGRGHRILKLQLTGKIHRANQEYLSTTTECFNKIRQRAFHYWTGTSGQRPEEEEILFEGFATVLGVLESHLSEPSVSV